MFEIKIFVEDKKLSSFLWTLDGQIIGQPIIIPVRGASSKRGKLILSNSGDNVSSQVYQKLLDLGATHATDNNIASAIAECGGKPSIRSYVIQQLKKAGSISTRIQQGKLAGSYKVLKPRKASK